MSVPACASRANAHTVRGTLAGPSRAPSWDIVQRAVSARNILARPDLSTNAKLIVSSAILNYGDRPFTLEAIGRLVQMDAKATGQICGNLVRRGLMVSRRAVVEYTDEGRPVRLRQYRIVIEAVSA